MKFKKEIYFWVNLYFRNELGIFQVDNKFFKILRVFLVLKRLKIDF
jgi:hypothetical protein